MRMRTRSHYIQLRQSWHAPSLYAQADTSSSRAGYKNVELTEPYLPTRQNAHYSGQVKTDKRVYEHHKSPLALKRRDTTANDRTNTLVAETSVRSFYWPFNDCQILDYRRPSIIRINLWRSSGLCDNKD